MQRFVFFCIFHLNQFPNFSLVCILMPSIPIRARGSACLLPALHTTVRSARRFSVFLHGFLFSFPPFTLAGVTIWFLASFSWPLIFLSRDAARRKQGRHSISIIIITCYYCYHIILPSFSVFPLFTPRATRPKITAFFGSSFFSSATKTPAEKRHINLKCSL